MSKIQFYCFKQRKFELKTTEKTFYLYIQPVLLHLHLQDLQHDDHYHDQPSGLHGGQLDCVVTGCTLQIGSNGTGGGPAVAVR